MVFALLVTASLSSILAGFVLFALSVRNTYAILLAQFIVSFASSFGMAYYVGNGSIGTAYIAGVSGIVSAVIFSVLYFLHKTIGPLEDRSPGPIGRKMQHSHQRGHH